MEYNAEQRALIRRMGEVSARHRSIIAAGRASHRRSVRDLASLTADLMDAIERSDQLGALEQEYGDAFREFLDTLT
jgi:hypothetical protein